MELQCIKMEKNPSLRAPIMERTEKEFQLDKGKIIFFTLFGKERSFGGGKEYFEGTNSSQQPL